MDEHAGLVKIATDTIFEGGGVEALDGGGVVEEAGAKEEDAALGRAVI